MSLAEPRALATLQSSVPATKPLPRFPSNINNFHLIYMSEESKCWVSLNSSPTSSSFSYFYLRHGLQYLNLVDMMFDSLFVA